MTNQKKKFECLKKIENKRTKGKKFFYQIKKTFLNLIIKLSKNNLFSLEKY